MTTVVTNSIKTLWTKKRTPPLFAFAGKVLQPFNLVLIFSESDRQLTPIHFSKNDEHVFQILKLVWEKNPQKNKAMMKG